MSKNRQYAKGGQIAALDIGTSKVACFIGRLDHLGHLKITGVGHQLSKGIRAGTIIDIKEAENSIINAVHAAEQMAEETIEQVVVSVQGAHVMSHQVHVGLELAGDPVNQRDLTDIIEEAQRSVSTSYDQVIHTIPLRYTLDGQRGIQDPKGMVGSRIESDMHVVSMPFNVVRNLANCLARCHLNLVDVVSASQAAGLGCLEPDEMELGVTLIEMGGGTTNISTFQEGKLLWATSIPLGGAHVTNDIAKGLSTSLNHAERLKTLHGSVLSSAADNMATIDVPMLGESDNEDEGNFMPRSALIGIIRPRVEELFEIIQRKLQAAGLDKSMGRHVVMTGGASQLMGVRELASKVLGKQVRLGRPRVLSGLADAVSGPAFTTIAGTMEYARLRAMLTHNPATNPAHVGARAAAFRLLDWVRRNF